MSICLLGFYYVLLRYIRVFHAYKITTYNSLLGSGLLLH